MPTRKILSKSQLARAFALVHWLFLLSTGSAHAQSTYMSTESPSLNGSKQGDLTDAYGRKIRTVTAIGIGLDVNEAAQNAAQNALSEVVGTFIDASTSLEKRTRIEDGIKTQTKQLRTDIREYSQGYVQSFSIQKIEKVSGFVQITAVVSIRVDDFKAYVLKLAEGERDLPNGLFAQLSVAEAQNRNLGALFSEKIIAVLNGQASQIQVGLPKTAQDLPQEFVNENYQISRFIDANRGKMLVYFPIRISIDSKYLENMLQTFEATAASRHRINVSSSQDTSREVSYRARELRGVGVVVKDDKNGSSGSLMTGYAFSAGAVSDKVAWLNDCEGGTYRNEIPYPSLEIKLVDGGGRDLFFSVLEPDPEHTGYSSGNVIVIDTDPLTGREAANMPPWSLIRCTGMDSGKPTIIRSSVNFMLLMAMDARTMENA
ncbi:MAG: hypothetical protein RL145_1038, partial [Pseudomonadota bacterium]